jgi:hypothetical protein
MRRIAYAALMVAVGLTGAYAESIPNFELLTLVGFASGVLLGARLGAGVAALTMLVFSLLNPYGAAPPLVTASQVIGAALSGVAGALCIGVARRSVAARVVVLGLVGAVLTLVFDLLTNLASGVVFGQMRVILLGGIPFALWHIATNTALFAAVGPVLVPVLARYRERLSSSR